MIIQSRSETLRVCSFDGDGVRHEERFEGIVPNRMRSTSFELLRSLFRGS